MLLARQTPFLIASGIQNRLSLADSCASVTAVRASCSTCLLCSFERARLTWPYTPSANTSSSAEIRIP